MRLPLIFSKLPSGIFTISNNKEGLSIARGFLNIDANFNAYSINPTFCILIRPKYRNVERIFGKYVKLGNDNDYGLYDEEGKTIIAPEYSLIEPMFGKMFLTRKKT